MNESLTPQRQEVFNMLLHYRKQGLVSAVLSRGGEVFFALNRGEVLIKTKSREEVESKLNHLLESGMNPAAHLRTVSPGAAPGQKSRPASAPGAESATAAASIADREEEERHPRARVQSGESRVGGPAQIEETAQPLVPPTPGRLDPDPRADSGDSGGGAPHGSCRRCT